MLVSAAARVIGLLIGARVNVQVASAPKSPFAPLGFGTIDELQLTASGNFDARRCLLPLQAYSLTGRDVELGWKAPALALAPLWIIFRPTLLPLLLLAWIKLPNTGRGELEWECFASAAQLNNGLWRLMLGLVLDGISRTSLPGLLMSINPDGTQRNPLALPRSVCTSVAVEKSKLILNGQLQKFDVSREPLLAQGTDVPVVTELGPLDYTLRMGLRPGRVERDGTVLDDNSMMRDGDGRRSCLIWDTPELRLSLGDNPVLRLLPQLWVPVAASCCVALPRGNSLRRAVVSDAGDGVSVGGALALAQQADEGGGYGLAVRS